MSKSRSSSRPSGLKRAVRVVLWLLLVLILIAGILAIVLLVRSFILEQAATSQRVVPTATSSVRPAKTAAPAATPRAVATPMAAPTQPAGLATGVVVDVVDGDTIDVRLNGKKERLRLIGINTPESVDPRRPVQCFGLEASKHAKELLTGKQVRLEADPSQDNRDRYDRLLRFVWMDDGQLFNLRMISDGYAYEYTYDLPYKYQREFRAAQETARAAKLGLWAQQTCDGRLEPNGPTPTHFPTPTPTMVTLGVPPDGKSCPAGYQVKGNISSRSDKIYYLPGSTGYGQVVPERCFANAAQAEQAGFRERR